MIVQPAIRLEHFSLTAGSNNLTLSLDAGQILGVYGRSGSGKTRFLKVLAGKEKPAGGSVFMEPKRILCDTSLLPSRGKVHTLAKSDNPQRTSEALSILGLWEVRNSTFDRLSSSQAAAACLLPTLTQNVEVVMIDGLVDALDPIVTKSYWAAIQQLRLRGLIVIVASHRLDFAQKCDALVVLKQGRFEYTGSVEYLENRLEPVQMTVETKNATALKNMIEPFCVRIEETEIGLRLSTFEGQSVAQKLLLNGYGDVRYLYSELPKLENLLEALL